MKISFNKEHWSHLAALAFYHLSDLPNFQQIACAFIDTFEYQREHYAFALEAKEIDTQQALVTTMECAVRFYTCTDPIPHQISELPQTKVDLQKIKKFQKTSLCAIESSEFIESFSFHLEYWRHRLPKGLIFDEEKYSTELLRGAFSEYILNKNNFCVNWT